jgi:hypothetical protein
MSTKNIRYLNFYTPFAYFTQVTTEYITESPKPFNKLDEI